MKDLRICSNLIEGALDVISMTPKELDELVFISTYEVDDPQSPFEEKHGYQRPPTNSRFSEVANHYRKGTNAKRIPPLVASVRIKDVKQIDRFRNLLQKKDFKAIHNEHGKAVVSLVDGQHRLKGLVKAQEDDPQFVPSVPVALYYGLDFVQEAEYFNTVNATQRKLPKALLETNRGDITENGTLSYAQRIRQIAFQLCRDEDSVWGPKGGVTEINMTGVRDPNRTVTYEGIRRSTASMFPPQLLDRLTTKGQKEPIKLAKRYWKAVSEACEGAWHNKPSKRSVKGDDDQLVEEAIEYRIKDLVGVAALAKLGHDIIGSELESGQKGKLEELVGKLSKVNWTKDGSNEWMRSQAGFAGQKELYMTLYLWVYADKLPE